MDMNTLKETVQHDLHKIGVSIGDEKGIYFSEQLGCHAPGDYFFVNDKGFHCVSIDDRGNIEPEVTYRDAEGILFALYWGITANLAVEYARLHQKSGEDWRRTMFAKQLELLQVLGEPYYIKGKHAIDEVLANSPYNDALF